MNVNMAPTLAEVLAARDNRAARHALLSARSAEDVTLVALTIVTPGPVKRSYRSVAAGNAACIALTAVFAHNILESEIFDLPTGFEADFLISLPAAEVKRKAMEIEERHPLGRLFDIDIISANGTPLSRKDAGLPERRCLLCDSPARLCMRAGRHSRDEIAGYVAGLIDSYLHSSSQILR